MASRTSLIHTTTHDEDPKFIPSLRPKGVYPAAFFPVTSPISVLIVVLHPFIALYEILFAPHRNQVGTNVLQVNCL